MRKLATVRTISNISPIPDADAIEVAQIDGWKVVVKKGEFNVGDSVVYCEIDSWIPHELAPFLSKGKDPRKYNDVSGERLKTITLRGQISQGLILPISHVPENMRLNGVDLTEILNVQKWEPPIPAELAGSVEGVFPGFIPKTDQERIQNLTEEFEGWRNLSWEVTEKIDGSSMTAFSYKGRFGVCSRNWEIKESETNTFWRMAKKYELKSVLGNLNFAIQGEVIGPGIQGNKYALNDHAFYIFDIYNIDEKRYCTPSERKDMLLSMEKFDIKHVPVLFEDFNIGEKTISEIIEMADGNSVLNEKTKREGLVFKCGESSFKAISNKWLKRYDE